MKKALKIIPLVYFIFLGVFWFMETYTSIGVINYYALGVLLVLLIELFYNHKIAGLVTGGLLGVFCIFRLAVLLSGIVKDGGVQPNMVRFIAFGSGMFGIGIIMAGLLVYYHVRLAGANKNNSATSI